MCSTNGVLTTRLHAVCSEHRAMPARGSSALTASVATWQGLDKGAVAEAKASVKALLEYLNLPKYAPLQRLLSGRRSADVVETACALAAIVQPFDNPALVA